jgi:YbbR domain-containing protein
MFSLNSRKLLAKVVENWPAKMLSVGLALILFIFHRMSTLEERFFSVPLLVEADTALIPASSYTRIVKVSLRGDANSIYPILEEDIEAFIDLKKYNAEGWYRAPVQVRKKGTALGVEPLEISVDPMEISLQLDRRISKYVPLTANIRGNLESGYDLVSHSLSPTQVVADGPLSMLEDLSELYTDFIDLDGRNEDFTVMVNILNRDPLIVIRGNGITEFRGFIRRSVPVRNIDDIPITLINLDERFEADMGGRAGNVRLEGSQSQLDQFEPSTGFFTLDCINIAAPGEYTLPVAINLPQGLSLLRREPVELSFTVSLKENP